MITGSMKGQGDPIEAVLTIVVLLIFLPAFLQVFNSISNEDEIDKLEQENQKLQERIDRLQQTVNELNQTNQELRNQLEELNQTENNSTSGNNGNNTQTEVVYESSPPDIYFYLFLSISFVIGLSLNFTLFGMEGLIELGSRREEEENEGSKSESDTEEEVDDRDEES
jgi:TolA-binding protein